MGTQIKSQNPSSASAPAQAGGGPAKPKRKFDLRDERYESASIGLILAVMVLVFAILTPSGTFLSFDNLKSISLDASQALILAAGMTFLLIAAGLDLSIGSMVIFSSVAAAKVMVAITGVDAAAAPAASTPHLAGALIIGIGAGLLCGLGWGLVNGILAVRFKIPPFIATLATAGIILGLSQVWTGGLNVQGVPLEFQRFFGLGELGGVIPWPVVVTAAVVGLLWVVLARTRFGLRTYAIGANPDAARRAGVNVDRHLLFLYALLGILAGLVGIIDVARFNTASISGHTQDALAAIAAVVIGGTSLFGGRGRMSGTVIGAFIPAVLLNGFVILDVQPFWQNVAVGCVLLVAVYVDQVRRRRLTFA